jgi:hypothetical protein
VVTLSAMTEQLVHLLRAGQLLRAVGARSVSTLVLAALPVAGLGFGGLVASTSPATGIVVVVGVSLVMIAVVCVLPAMRLLAAPPETLADAAVRA